MGVWGRSDSKEGAEAFVVQPFTRLARTHGLSVAGDALLAVALADSLFFNVDPNDARWKVAAYLVLTIAPFAVVAPFLGPLMDRWRGGHRYMMIGAALVRAALMVALVRYVQGPVLFPLAFSMLVMAKTHAVAKSALVPAMVRSEEALVKSNARLSVLAGVSSGVAGVPGVILLQLFGSGAVLGLGAVVFAGAALFALQIPRVTIAPSPPEPQEKAELRSAGVVLAATAMGYLRGVAGFITLLLAFTLRGGIDPGPTAPGVNIGHQVRESLGFEQLDLTTGGAPVWHFGLALVGVGLGGLVAALSVPRLRTMVPEERILAMALLSLAGLCGLAALSTQPVGAFVAGFAVALAGTGGKQSFDAIVQRDAPKANLGRSFAKFESRFQLFWVVGALVPAVVPFPAPLGFGLVTVTGLFVGGSYWFGRRPDPRAVLNGEGVPERFRPTITLPWRRSPEEAEPSGGPGSPDDTELIEGPGSPDDVEPAVAPDVDEEPTTPLMIELDAPSAGDEDPAPDDETTEVQL